MVDEASKRVPFRLSAELDRWHRREIGDDEFFRNVAEDVRRMARRLFQRWRLPAGVSVEDVEQEIRQAIWVALPQWDPTKATLHAYVTFSSHSRAKKWIHKQRNALRRDGHNPGRYEFAVSSLSREGDAGDVELPEPCVEADQEDAAERAEALSAVVSVLAGGDRFAAVALAAAGGSVDVAAELVYQDVGASVAMRLGSLPQARRKVADAAGRVVEAARARRAG